MISNNYIPEKINDANAYLDGTRMIGVAASVDLPEVNMKTGTVEGFGVGGEIDSPTIGQWESFEQEVQFNTLYSSAVDMLNPLTVVNLTFRAAQQVYDKTGGYDFKGLRVVEMGRVKKFKPGKIEKSEGMEATVTLELTYIMIEVDGEQLCAEINNANHGRVKLKFSVMGNWGVSAGNNLRLTGYGDGLNGGINGKYFVDKVTHKYTKSGGFVTSFECSGIFDPFHYWDVGGHIEYHQSEDSSSESYNSAYETTSPAANAASAAAGATAGAAVTLTKAPFYYTSVAPKPSCYKSGTFYFYDGILVNNRYRITNTAARCGKLPVGKNVTGWVPASYCNGGGITTK